MEFEEKIIKLTSMKPNGFKEFEKCVYSLFAEDEISMSQMRDCYTIGFIGNNDSLYYDWYNKTWSASENITIYTSKTIGADSWGRKVYQNIESKRLYKDPKSLNYSGLHTTDSFEGEPDCPLREDLIINYIEED